MTGARHRLALRHNYREDVCGGSQIEETALRHLDDAADALNMAVLTLDGPVDEGRTALNRRATHARRLLAEAVSALSRARLYVKGVRTYSLPVIMASEGELDAELARLHQICARLLWFNHEYLPAKIQADPLTDEDEAQLALVLKDLALHARIDRAMRHKWIAATALSCALIPLLGAPIILAAIGCVAMAGVQLVRATPLATG